MGSMNRLAQTFTALALAAGVEPAFAQSGDGASMIEKVKERIERIGIAERLDPEEGIYPRIGGLTTGSGLALGAGYRTELLVPVDVSAMLSTKLYKEFQAKARWAAFGGDRVELWTTYRWRDFPQEDFYGLGDESLESNRSDYGIRSNDVSARAVVRITRTLRGGLDIGLYMPSLFPGTDDTMPTTQDLFTDVGAPGIAAQPKFFYRSVFLDLDTRDVPGNPSRGGRWIVSYGEWNDRTLDEYDYHRFDLEGAHFVPLAPARHVLALHGMLSFVNNRLDDRVPFYAFPYVGGADTVRGFNEFRFRDENTLVLSAEYRFDLIKFVELAAFVDAGEARHHWGEIGLGGMHTSYGGGIRVKTAKNVLARLDVGVGGGEGTRVFMKFGKSF
jgi:outer membrane protein assembly factor BamA